MSESTDSKGSVLIVPACDKDRGGGHLNRCLFLLEALEEGGRESYLWISEEQKEDVFIRFRSFMEKSEYSKGFNARLLSDKDDLKKYKWEFIIIDNFRTSKIDFAYWSMLGPTIGIDEGGECRSSFDFLIDLLPALKEYKPNLVSPSLLPLPKNRRRAGGTNDGKKIKVLICFGAEDSKKLGISSAKALSAFSSPIDITLITPHADSGAAKLSIPGVKISGLIPNLKEHLAEYDLFISHFGISAFEAIYARVPVLLISPSSYHAKLALNAGFYSVSGIEQLNAKIFKPLSLKKLEDRRKKIAVRYSLEAEQKEDLGSFFESLSLNVYSSCPVCSFKAASCETKVLFRSPYETYRRCPNCKNIFLNRLNDAPIVYNREYFFDLYKKQYGKTYLDDFPKLMEMGERRLNYIKNLLNNDTDLKPRLFDIGCAYGAFMKAASINGFSPYGIDPIEDAVDYIKEELALPAWQGYFPSRVKAEDGPFDAVTLWFVIEHFKETAGIFKEIYRILRNNGVLAFSTPSFSGVSGKKNLSRFLKSSPPDHYTIFSPSSCKKILSQYGFKVRKIIVTGHHPARFPLIGKLFANKNNGLLFNLMNCISRFFKLGDTFEVYCVKKPIANKLKNNLML